MGCSAEEACDTISGLLCGWYEQQKRDLPWRKDNDPYHIWVSEIMLQQTRVEAVRPYYLRFLNVLPDIVSLAECPEDRLLKLWEGLGYYSRARNMRKAARILTERYDGHLPRTYAELLKLPGIGPYTAGAIASIAYRQPVPAVDGNVIRVAARITGDERDVRESAVRTSVEEWVLRNMPPGRPDIFNQALMELGAVVCVPNGPPLCGVCPLSSGCLARKQGMTERIPYKSPAAARKIEEKTVLVIYDGIYVLIRKRSRKGLLAGMYEFPSMDGRCSGKQVLEFVGKQMKIPVTRMLPLPAAKHVFSHIEWHMTGYLVRAEDLSLFEERNRETVSCPGENYLVIEPDRTQTDYPIPAAFRAYAAALKIEIGLNKIETGD